MNARLSQTLDEAIAALEEQRALIRNALLSLLYLQSRLEAERRKSRHGAAELGEVRAQLRRTQSRLLDCSAQLDDLRARRLAARAHHTLAAVDDALACAADDRATTALAEHEAELLLAR